MMLSNRDVLENVAEVNGMGLIGAAALSFADHFPEPLEIAAYVLAGEMFLAATALAAFTIYKVTYAKSKS